MTETNGDGGVHFTPTQQRILTLLSDGYGHQAEEVLGCLGDPSLATLRVHLTHLRSKLQPNGQNIVVHILDGKTYYQQVRVIASAYRG